MATSGNPARLSESAVRPVQTLDPLASLDDLEWLGDAIGDARVVAIGENAHYNRESFQLRHRLLRYLVERHNRATADGVGFYGIDLPGSKVSLLPGLDAVTGYLAQADPGFKVDPGIRETSSTFSAASAFSAPAAIDAYSKLAPERRNALTASLAELAARMKCRRPGYLRLTTLDACERAVRCLDVTVALNALRSARVQADRGEMMLAREAAIADTVEWVMRREDRVVLGAHNGHVQRVHADLPGMASAPTMGARLAERLGGQEAALWRLLRRPERARRVQHRGAPAARHPGQFRR